MSKQEEYVTIEEAAKMYKTSPDTIRRRIRTGQLPSCKPFGIVLIKTIDLEKLVKKTTRAS